VYEDEENGGVMEEDVAVEALILLRWKSWTGLIGGDVAFEFRVLKNGTSA